MVDRVERAHPEGCGCAVCTRRRERLETDPRERELAAADDPQFEHAAGDQSEPAVEHDTDTVREREVVERERVVEEHHHHDRKRGKDGKDGRDGKPHGGGHDGHRFARKHHRHPRRGILSTLLVGALLLFVLHSFYPNLNIPLVPGIVCAPGPISSTETPGAAPVSAAGVEPVGLGSDLGGLAQDTVGAVLKTIARAAAEHVLHAIGDTVGEMLSHAPSPADIRTGLSHDFELAGRAVGFVAAGLQGKSLADTNVSDTVATSGGACGACPGTAVPASGPALPGLTAEQSRNAYSIIRTGQSMRVPTRGLVVALTAASQESGIRNLHYGDRDSQGLFQMRPSMGWGTVAQVTDPAYAARKFYNVLNGVRGWQLMSVTEAAQAVERSGFPGAYAKWEPRAWSVVRAVTAKSQVRSVAYTVPHAAVNGLQPVAVQAENYVRRAFGFKGSIGGFARSGHISNSKHYQGLAIDVMVPLGPLADRITSYFAGPGYSKWHVDNVIHNHRIFNAGRGWHAYPERGNPTLNHEDHVHIDFVSGTAVSAAVAGAPATGSGDCGTGGVVGASQTSGGGFTLATFNVLGASHTGVASATRRMHHTVAALNAHRVDIVGLQEFQGVQAHQFHRLTRGTYTRWGAPGDPQNSVAWRTTRFQLLGTRLVPVPYFDGHTRLMPAVHLQGAGGRLWVLNVHNPADTRRFPRQGVNRARAVRVERAALAVLRQTGDPVYMTGDMNARTAFGAPMRADGMVSATGYSYRGIDWILGSQGTRFVGTRVDDSRGVDAASDHPLVVTRVPAAAPVRVMDVGQAR